MSCEDDKYLVIWFRRTNAAAVPLLQRIGLPCPPLRYPIFFSRTMSAPARTYLAVPDRLHSGILSTARTLADAVTCHCPRHHVQHPRSFLRGHRPAGVELGPAASRGVQVKGDVSPVHPHRRQRACIPLVDERGPQALATARYQLAMVPLLSLLVWYGLRKLVSFCRGLDSTNA